MYSSLFVAVELTAGGNIECLLTNKPPTFESNTRRRKTIAWCEGGNVSKQGERVGIQNPSDVNGVFC